MTQSLHDALASYGQSSDPRDIIAALVKRPVKTLPPQPISDWTPEIIAATPRPRDTNARLVAVAALWQAASIAQQPQPEKLCTPADAARVMAHLATLPQEEFWALFLDTKNRLMSKHMITRGLLDRCPVHPREVFREAIRANCQRIIVVHNHPSKDPTPSANDIASTRLLCEAGRVIGIELVDSVIIGTPTNYSSLRELGLLPQSGDKPNPYI